jgi:adenosylcobinamide-GDP ribazoletransferase
MHALKYFKSLTHSGIADLVACLRFYSRLPMPALAIESNPYAMPDFARLIPMLPAAGALIGLCGATVLAVADSVKLPPLVSASLCIVCLLHATGCLHEDGLADTADGFGGGPSVSRKLEIMRDSRLGTYGATALCLSLILRIVLIATVLERLGVLSAAMSVVAAAAVSRTAGLFPLALLAPARLDGAGFSAQRPSLRRVSAAAGLSCLLAVAVCHFGAIAGLRAFLACLAAFAGGLYITVLSWRHIGGQTGDVAGAAQQLAEVAFLIVLLVQIDA